VAPDSASAGYSGTPLPRKLGIREGALVGLLGAPEDVDAILGDLPPGTELAREPHGDAAESPDLVLLFARSRAELEQGFDRAIGLGAPIWVAWPKRASRVQTDLTEDVVRDHGLERGWVDHKVAAIDATWSGLRFARRKA
jgi:hypothetical protein